MKSHWCTAFPEQNRIVGFDVTLVELLRGAKGNVGSSFETLVNAIGAILATSDPRLSGDEDQR
jgi:hypothetical protein